MAETRQATTILSFILDCGEAIAGRFKGFEVAYHGLNVQATSPPDYPPEGQDLPLWGISHHPNFHVMGTLYPWSVWVFVCNNKGDLIREVLLLEPQDKIGEECNSFTNRLKTLYPHLFTAKIRKPRRKKNGVEAVEEFLEPEGDFGEQLETPVASNYA